MTHSIPEWWSSKTGWNFWGEYENGQWETETHAWIDEYVTPGSTYVDIGAWIGPTVLWAAPKAGRVLAVEPDEVARKHLAENVAGLTNVEIIPGAVADHTGTAEICPHSEGYGSSMTRLLGESLPAPNSWCADLARTVDCWTLPDLFTTFAVSDVSLVKMDIEGGESEILEAVCPFLAERKIPFIVSLHHSWWNTPVERYWFDCFSEVRGNWGETAPLLMIP